MTPALTAPRASRVALALPHNLDTRDPLSPPLVWIAVALKWTGWKGCARQSAGSPGWRGGTREGQAPSGDKR